MFWLLVAVLWAAVLLSPVLVLYFFLPVGRGCPRCGGETLLIRSRLLRPLRRIAHLRWCTNCHWEGVMRPTTWPRPLPKLEAVPDDSDDPDGTAPWKGGSGA